MNTAKIEISRKCLSEFLTQTRFTSVTFCRDYQLGKQLLRDSISLNDQMGPLVLRVTEAEKVEQEAVCKPKTDGE